VSGCDLGIRTAVAGCVVRALCHSRPHYGVRDLAAGCTTVPAFISHVVGLLERDSVVVCEDRESDPRLGLVVSPRPADRPGRLARAVWPGAKSRERGRIERNQKRVSETSAVRQSCRAVAGGQPRPRTLPSHRAACTACGLERAPVAPTSSPRRLHRTGCTAPWTTPRCRAAATRRPRLPRGHALRPRPRHRAP
jgi:hypothetical protein